MALHSNSHDVIWRRLRAIHSGPASQALQNLNTNKGHSKESHVKSQLQWAMAQVLNNTHSSSLLPPTFPTGEFTRYYDDMRRHRASESSGATSHPLFTHRVGSRAPTSDAVAPLRTVGSNVQVSERHQFSNAHIAGVTWAQWVVRVTSQAVVVERLLPKFREQGGRNRAHQ